MPWFIFTVSLGNVDISAETWKLSWFCSRGAATTPQRWVGAWTCPYLLLGIPTRNSVGVYGTAHLGLHKFSLPARTPCLFPRGTHDPSQGMPQQQVMMCLPYQGLKARWAPPAWPLGVPCRSCWTPPTFFCEWKALQGGCHLHNGCEFFIFLKCIFQRDRVL